MGRTVVHRHSQLYSVLPKGIKGNSKGPKLRIESDYQVRYMMLLSAVLNTSANLENSVLATGLEKFSFYFNPKERQYQIMFKLLHNHTHLTC